MSHAVIRNPLAAEIMGRWRLFMYPRLRGIPADARDEVLRAARQTELDTLERVGILVGLVGATAILQTVGADWSSQLARYLAQFALALPLLGFLVGPFLLRRTRRGLDILSLNQGNE